MPNLRHLGRTLANEGVAKQVRHLWNRLVERHYEHWLGISSSDTIALRDFGIADERFFDHVPSRYVAVRKLMGMIRIGPEDVFLDIGSGMGRVALMAATYPFKRVLGVEIAPELNAVAERNLTLARARGRLRCLDVQFYTADATSYVIPSDVTFVYLYNPFSEEILRATLENIRRLPGEVRVLSLSPSVVSRLDTALASVPWLKVEQRATAAGVLHLAVYRLRHSTEANQERAAEG